MRKLFLGVFSAIWVSAASGQPALTSSAGAEAGAIASSAPTQIVNTTNQPISGLGQAEADASNSFAVQFNSYGAKKIPPGSAGSVLPGSSAPGLFTSPHSPGYVLGTGMTVEFIRQCDPTIRGGARSELVRERGDSGNTSIVFWADPSSYRLKRKTVPKDSREWCDPDRADFVQCMKKRPDLVFADTDTVSFEFPEDGRRKKVEGICLGIMSVEATLPGKGETVPPMVLGHDAMNFAYDRIKGFRDLVLVSHPDIIGYALGIRSEGRGVGISPGGSASIASTMLGSLVGGFSTSKGDSGYVHLPGTTFVVVALHEGSGAVLFDPLRTDRKQVPSRQSVNGNGIGDGVKLEASRQK